MTRDRHTKIVVATALWAACNVERAFVSMKPQTRFLSAVFVVGCACCAIETAPRPNVKLNEDSLHFAEELIERGHFVSDKKNTWNEHQSSAEDENEFIRQHGFAEYAKWHLGIDARHAENTKARYKFPYGDFKGVHWCALLAIKSRAHQYGDSEIENAAVHLLEMIQSEKKQTASLP